MKPIVRSYLTEINLGATVPGNGQNIQFIDYPQLRDIFILGITSLDNNSLSKSPSGKDVVSTLTGVTVTLMDKYNMEIIYQYPALDLDPFYQSGFYRDFKPFPLQLTKSYITILDNSALVANESLCFNVFYITKADFKTLQNARK
jgi:hypothetical protein